MRLQPTRLQQGGLTAAAGLEDNGDGGDGGDDGALPPLSPCRTGTGQDDDDDRVCFRVARAVKEWSVGEELNESESVT